MSAISRTAETEDAEALLTRCAGDDGVAFRLLDDRWGDRLYGKTVRLPPNLRERILSRICCHRVLPRDPQGDAVKPTAPTIVQQPERNSISARTTSEKRFGVLGRRGAGNGGHGASVFGSILAYTEPRLKWMQDAASLPAARPLLGPDRLDV